MIKRKRGREDRKEEEIGRGKQKYRDRGIQTTVVGGKQRERERERERGQKEEKRRGRAASSYSGAVQRAGVTGGDVAKSPLNKAPDNSISHSSHKDPHQ